MFTDGEWNNQQNLWFETPNLALVLQTDAFLSCVLRELSWTPSLQSARVLNSHGTLQNYYPISPFTELKKKVGIISFLLKHMALTTFNGKQRHEIITKCRTLWHRLKWKKKKQYANCQHSQPVNQLALCYLFQCPPLC